MNFIVVLRAAAALLTLGAALAPALAEDADTCRKASGDDSIVACSRLLARNPKDAGAYYSRGYAYEWRKGDHLPTSIRRLSSIRNSLSSPAR